MSRLRQQPKVSVSATIELSLPEMQALQALACYGIDAFLRNFYKVMGETYLRPHEIGLRSLFETIGSDLPAIIRRADAAKTAFVLQDPVIRSRQDFDAMVERVRAQDSKTQRSDGFVAGFICAGGDSEEAKRQAPQFQSCVEAAGARAATTQGEA